MPASSLVDVKHQLTFYGAYHDHPINVLIHMIFVPAILWSALILGSHAPWPDFFPQLHLTFGNYFAFDLNWSGLWVVFVGIYYYFLEPTAALIYTPEWLVIGLNAAAYARKPDGLKNALLLHVASWVAQFSGHFFAEGRSPALLDNLLGALVLAPFFVHLEILFKLGYKPQLRENIHQSVKQTIADIKTSEAQAKKKEL
ncbi:hypothetical protein TRAPUB_12979 [Trametes pubescens]|uniref:Endoplasmic reticulum membrane protein C16E8.02 n=1 Tax=Trametes pubescens TaxID=154538 RepID=A0A1M2VSG3_TRAPU|nr:hypothetical protein TRAPUB_12979 [Trametes pubescens]